jgi:PIN domain nuclease of toxin-antitoxin system
LGGDALILLDTHIWRWWLSDPKRLDAAQLQAISDADRVAISVVSCWEVAKAVESGTLQFSVPVKQSIDGAITHPKLTVLPLTPQIAVASTLLPKPIHKDPGDQLIIATARELNIRLLTADAKILAYSHVQLA